ncbi:unnamed protein product [Trichobilharzia regenti]|nr:unnamed protein product [Trichobilharzia regenti]
MKSNLSTLNNAPSTSGKSLSSFINKSCFSALKKSSSESTKLTQLTNILNLNQTLSPPSPGNPSHHPYYYQQHQPVQLEATPLSSTTTTTTPLQHCCPPVDQSTVRLSSCLTSPNLLRQSNSLNCSSSMSNINNNCTTGEFTASQTTPGLHQTMTNKCFVRTDLKNLHTDLQLASTLSYPPPLSSNPVYHFHQKQLQNPFHGQLQQQQQQQQQPQKKVNSPSKVTENETSCSDKVS